jgi:hypothetical protein
VFLDCKIIITIIIFIIFFNIFPNQSISVNDIHSDPENFYRDYCEKDSTIKKSYNQLSNISKFFIKNCGQLNNSQIYFYTSDNCYWFANNGALFELNNKKGIKKQEPIDYLNYMNVESQKNEIYEKVILKQEFIGINSIKPKGKKPSDFYNNYFYGNDPSKFVTNVPCYQEIYYENLYDGIDLRFYLVQNGLKYDFIIHPYADIERIKIKYFGIDHIDINRNGDLIIKSKIGNIIHRDLEIYQNYSGVKSKINGRFKIYNKFEYGFELLQDYNPYEILVIDPLIYSSFLGGYDREEANSIAIDEIGNSYVTGLSASPNFPTSPGVYDIDYNGGHYDVFVLKLNYTGSNLIYSTFIGGSNTDIGNDLVIDSFGNVFVTGDTKSSNFPNSTNAFDLTFNGGENDIFVLKLNKNGDELLYSTFIGDVNDESGSSIDIDSTGNAYVTGYTTSSNFPTTNGVHDTSYNNIEDVFILKINQTGSKLLFSTFVGESGKDWGCDIKIDSLGNSYITGYTSSSNFPITQNVYDESLNGNYDCFVLKLNQIGTEILFSTFLGGNLNDKANSIFIDSQKNVFITGKTNSKNFPTTKKAFDNEHNGKNDSFVAKLNPLGSLLLYSTYFGGNDEEEGFDITLDSNDNLYFSGYTSSSDFPITQDAYDKSLDLYDCFLVKLDRNGSKLIYSSYIGGAKGDIGKCIKVDSSFNIIICGYTASLDFPANLNGYDNTHNGDRDVFIFKFSISPIVYIDSFQLLRNNNSVNQIYARYSLYTFKIDIIDTFFSEDLENVVLVLDPLGTNIQFHWNQTQDKFIKFYDPYNYCSLDFSSSNINYLYWWTFEFNISFNWNYPVESYQDIQIYATSKSSKKVWMNITEAYCVENDIDFKGSLEVKGENNRSIYKNSVIRGNEHLSWTGLIPVYENTTKIYPPQEEFNITIWDETGEKWSDSPLPGLPFFILTETPQINDIDGFTYIINLTGIPPEHDKTLNKFVVRVDSQNVTFSNPIPSEKIWQTNSDIFIGITIMDSGGAKVNGSNIMYALSQNNGTTWSDWIPVSGLSDNKILSVQDKIYFEDSKKNYVKWRAADSVGNGPIESENYNVLVDTQSVFFSNPKPSSSEISLTNKVNVGIDIIDNTSGVNASTIEYSISNNKGKSWSDWKKIDNIENGLRIKVNITLLFQEGNNNLIKWRASDIAGNMIEESSHYIVNIKSQISQQISNVTLIQPLNGVTINKSTIELQWNLENNPFENITYSLFFDIRTPPKLWKQNISTTSQIIENLQNNTIYYWYVIPIHKDINGSCLSGIWWFKVELFSKDENFEFDLIAPYTVSIKQGERLLIEISLINYGNNEHNIGIELDAGKLFGDISLKDSYNIILPIKSKVNQTIEIIFSDKIKPGIYEVELKAISITNKNLDKKSHIITININDTNDDNNKKNFQKELENLIIFLMITIIIIIIIISFYIYRKKKQIKEKTAAPGSVTIKPGTIPTPIYTQEVVQSQLTPSQIIDTKTIDISLSSSFSNTSQSNYLAPRIKTSDTQKITTDQISQAPQQPQLPPKSAPVSNVDISLSQPQNQTVDDSVSNQIDNSNTVPEISLPDSPQTILNESMENNHKKTNEEDINKSTNQKEKNN